MTLIKSISGIRGTIGGPQGENLTPIDVVKFTTAYARLIAARNPEHKIRIVVGRDARLSGELVRDLVVGTLLASGADVIDVGLCTTPGTEMAVITKRADGGIIITASHNPRQWNALKLLNRVIGDFVAVGNVAEPIIDEIAAARKIMLYFQTLYINVADGKNIIFLELNHRAV